MEYLYLAVAVAVAVALSAGIARDHVRRRVGLTAAVILLGGYLSWAVRPDLSLTHLFGLVVVSAFVGAMVVAGRRGATLLMVVIAAVGTTAVLSVQTSSFPSAAQPLPSSEPEPEAPPNGGSPAISLDRMRDGAEFYQGTVLQLAERSTVTTEDTNNGRLLFGNIGRATGAQTVASYTGMGYDTFADTLCMDYRGAVCADAFTRVFAPASEAVDAPLIDVMGVSTLVLQRTLLPDVTSRPPPLGWRVATSDGARVVWTRDRLPVAGAGPATWSSSGVTYRTESSAPSEETLRVDAQAAGTVVFSRLNWPGYEATLDGSSVAVREGPAGLLAVDVPAGDGLLQVTYSSPGLALGRAAAALATGVVVIMSIGVGLVGRRRARSRRAGDSSLD